MCIRDSPRVDLAGWHRPFRGSPDGRDGKAKFRKPWQGPGFEIAVAVENLIALGHAPRDVWSYTPRQLKAWSQFAERRKRHEAAELVTLHAMASRGDPKEVERKLKLWTSD